MTRESWRRAFGDESREQLEAAVPDLVAERAWPRLAAELAAQARPGPSWASRWLVGGLAAALMVMLSVSGWLASENHGLRRQLALPVSPAVVVASAQPASARMVTAGELVARLAMLPPESIVLSEAEASALIRRDRPLLYALVRGPELDSMVAGGLSAREAVTVLRRLDQTTPVNLGGAALAAARTRS